ncbi:NAD-glutamate dehydrogenase [Streptomyces sp. HP-A2021]|uniref:NAD-glutamate dehydrogenase domain-containing protein n=1 Tax=Streptomyces sp. HP-A2021 TaxID=2927875 RepID=UPI001FAF4A35|nr:NAD-glutamate dehydrogenase domain-containing protein [Streptomyces sp. HP-A2021]UOB08019.1 NAD-glutamate dehydrogenase [Streptomyces sp. HP-A2021]
MQTKLDEAKAELLERAARVAENSPVGGYLPTGTTDESTPGTPDHTVLAFLQRYYLHTAPEDLTDRDPVDIFGATFSHYRLAENRPQGTANIRVHTPTVEENGWTCSHSVVEIVTDDMRFLVDSVMNELSRQGRGIHLVIHPDLIVRRDLTGKLIEVLLTPPTGDLPYDIYIESWIHVEIDRETDRADLKQITADLLRVLSDVHKAVEDWKKMRDAAIRLGDSLESEPVAIGPARAEVEEARELLRWLADDHFTFLGYREYQLRKDDSLAAVPGTGLGILRSDPHHAGDDSHPVSPSIERLPADARAKAREHKLLILTKANSRATVHRPSYLDYVGVKKFDANGEVIGERRFLGLFSSAAYTESVRRVPVIRRKVDEVLQGAGFSPNSHDGHDLLQILETYPRDELFQTPVPELQRIATSVLYLQERRRLRLYLRQDEYGRYYSALVYLPRDRYTTAVRLRIIDILKEELDGTSVDFTAWNTESILSRLHLVVRVPRGTELPQLSDADKERIEARLVEAARSWADGFADALYAEVDWDHVAELLRRYSGAFPEGYKADHSPRAAVADLLHLEQLTEDTNFSLSLYEPVGAAPEERRFKIYRTGDAISLSAVLPVLNRLGVEVIDERPYELRCSDRGVAWIYDFGLRMPRSGSGGDYLGDDARERFQDAFAATWTGKAENDGFNALVLSAGLTWRQAMVLRAYAKYLRQAGSTFSQDYMEDTLRNNVHTTRLLVSLFEARMSPDRQRARHEIVDALLEEVDAALDLISTLDQGRILRLFLTLISATVRTNFFQATALGQPHEYVSMKFDPQAIPDLPAPRPASEIWVYSPRVEGVHLTFGDASRGVVRWSHRREDFRREITGLAAMQTLRNGGVVTSSAVGSFVGKRLPDPVTARQTWLDEGLACYELFLSGVLDITDNVVSGKVVPPADVVRHDWDAPYLWLSPDPDMPGYEEACRRTDRLLRSYGFWLSDAFGGCGAQVSAVTARGAWEAVVERLDEAGQWARSRGFTAVGVGRAAGDLLADLLRRAEGIRLVAAFDDRHILLDPDPDQAVAHAERLRMFEEGHDSWASYAPSAISPGGGVHSMQVHQIVVTPQVRHALGLAASERELSPADMVRAIIAAPVDVLALGGNTVGIKSMDEEPPTAIGERHPIWVGSETLRAACLVELQAGAVTQAARCEYALRGGLVALDMADLAAAQFVDDHRAILSTGAHSGSGPPDWHGGSTVAASMLTRIGDDAVARCRELHALIALDARTGHAGMNEHLRAFSGLSRKGALEEWGRVRVPPERRVAAGAGLTRPELAALILDSHAALRDQVLKSALVPPDWAEELLHRYFSALPPEMRAETAEHHPLRARIAASEAAWELLNALGPSRPFSLARSGDGGLASLIRSFLACRGAWRACATIEETTAMSHPAAMASGLARREALSGSLLWLLAGSEDAPLTPPRIPEVSLPPPEMLDQNMVLPRVDDLVEMGVPTHLATNAGMLSVLGPQLDGTAAAVVSGEEMTDAVARFTSLALHYDVVGAGSTALAAIRSGTNDSAHHVSLLGQVRACLNAVATINGPRPPDTDRMEAIDALIRLPVPRTDVPIVHTLRRLHRDLRRARTRALADHTLAGRATSQPRG